MGERRRRWLEKVAASAMAPWSGRFSNSSCCWRRRWDKNICAAAAAARCRRPASCAQRAAQQRAARCAPPRCARRRRRAVDARWRAIQPAGLPLSRRIGFLSVREALLTISDGRSAADEGAGGLLRAKGDLRGCAHRDQGRGQTCRTDGVAGIYWFQRCNCGIQAGEEAGCTQCNGPAGAVATKMFAASILFAPLYHSRLSPVRATTRREAGFALRRALRDRPCEAGRCCCTLPCDERDCMALKLRTALLFVCGSLQKLGRVPVRLNEAGACDFKTSQH